MGNIHKRILEEPDIKIIYELRITEAKSDIASFQFRLGFDTGEPDRQFLEDMIKKRKEHIKIYEKLLEELKEKELCAEKQQDMTETHSAERQ